MNLYAVGLASALTFVAGWTGNGWRLGEHIAAKEAAAAKTETKARDAIITAERRAAEQTAEADARAQREIAENEQRLAEFERCIAAGAGCGLRIKVRTVPAATCVSSGDAPGVGAGGEQTAELDPALGPDYRALRTGIQRLEQALKVCVSAAHQSN